MIEPSADPGFWAALRDRSIGHSSKRDSRVARPYCQPVSGFTPPVTSKSGAKPARRFTLSRQSDDITNAKVVMVTIMSLWLPILLSAWRSCRLATMA